MDTVTSVNPKELFVQHLAALRGYAGRVILRGDVLDYHEQADRGQRMREALTMGSFFGLTAKEIIVLLYRPLFAKPACDCAVCRFRMGAQE